MNNNPLVSICIPTYGRPRPIKRALESIDIVRHAGDVEVVISENCSPVKEQTRQVVSDYSSICPYKVVYSENEQNLGYAGNIIALTKKANGAWIIFIGDDDMFVPKELDCYIDFILENDNLGYILHTYRGLDAQGDWEIMSHYNQNTFFAPGLESYINNYRLSVPVSGLTFRKDWFFKYVSQFGGIDALPQNYYYHLFFEAVMCLNTYSACYSNPIVQYVPFERTPEELEVYKTGKVVDVDDSDEYIALIKDNFVVSKYIDEKLGIRSTDRIVAEYSKYSLPMLSHYDYGTNNYKALTRALYDLGFNKTKYYRLYQIGLATIGAKGCYRLIAAIKHVLGKTPTL